MQVMQELKLYCDTMFNGSTTTTLGVFPVCCSNPSDLSEPEIVVLNEDPTALV